MLVSFAHQGISRYMAQSMKNGNDDNNTLPQDLFSKLGLKSNL